MQISASSTTQQGGGLAYKWLVAIVVIFGIFMSILDGTIVNVAIPRLQTAFGADLNSVQWVLTAYTLAQGVATPLTAYLANRVGTKRLYLFALAAFTLGSALCGIAWSLPVLIIFRILQGMAGAFLAPLSITMLYQVFPPEERGTAMGALGIPILLAPAFGPTLGGYIVTFASWQLIFYINVPIGIVGVILAILFLRSGTGEARHSFDLPGFLLSAVGLAALLYGLSDASTDGWGSAKVLGCLIIGVALLTIFTIVELRTARRGGQPLLDLRVFANGPFTSSNIASILVTFSLYGGLFIIPVYLQSLRGLSAYQSGLILLPQAFASMVAVVVGGRLVDKFGVRAVVLPGLVLLGISLWQFTSLSLSLPYGQFQLVQIIRGFGIGLCLQPLTVSSLAEIKPRMLAQASSVNTTLRFVTSSLAVSLIATLVQTQSKIHYSALAEQVTADSPLGQLVTRLQALFVAQGASLGAARSTTLQIVSGLVHKQAAILAMQDAFWLSLLLTGVALIATFFVRSRKREQVPAEPESLTDTEKEEEEKAREEALLAI